MNLSVVFNNTGDQIDFDVTLPDVAEFYVNWLDETGTNEFFDRPHLSKFKTHNRMLVVKHYDEMTTLLKERFGVTCFDDIDMTTEYFDQDKLNKIHYCFVKSLATVEPNIISELTEPGQLEKFRSLNQGVHYAEKHWRLRLSNRSLQPPDFIQPIKNPFERDLTTFDVGNLSLEYGGLGRQTFNKWENDDENIDDIDTHNFEEFYGQIAMNLFKPRTMPAPPEYVEYCKQHGMVPYGTHINIANVKDLVERSGMYRDILYNNIHQNNNSCYLVVGE